MDLNPSTEQEAIRDAIRGVLADRLPSARLRAVMAGDPCVDVELWNQAATLGWLGLAVAEAAGGAGYGLPEAMLLFVELGRSLAPGPWLGTVLAAQALAEAPSVRALLAGILTGSQRVAVVDDLADALGTGSTLRGEVGAVADAAAAHGILVVGSERIAYVPVGHGVEVDDRPSIDPTRRLARVAMAGAAPAHVAERGAGALRQVATVLAAAEALGVAERTREMSVEYAKVRQQFGRPIGSFQAIKHRCADMAVRAEVAGAAVAWAAVALQDGDVEGPFHVRVAKALATEAALANATDNVQNHGGMGYTWEADAHLHLKRARVLMHTFGSPVEHLDALAAPWRR